MPYFNFYAVQAKRLQALVPEKEIIYEGKDENYVFLKVDNKFKGIPRNDLRKMANLPLIARDL